MLQPRRVVVALYAASGAAALVYEVVWTRLLTLQLGHTVAAASTVLAAFMGGLALGATAAGRLLPVIGRTGVEGRNGQVEPPSRPARYLTVYAALEIAIALFALLLPIVLRATVPLLAWAYADGGAPTRFAVLRVAISFLLVGLPAAAMGATFPIASEWLAQRARGSFAAAGLLYAANTVGAAAGAVAAGFWLIPALGLHATTWIGVALNVVAAAGALWIASRPTAEKPATAEPSASSKPKTKTPPRAARSARLPSRVVPSAPSPRVAFAAVAVSGFSALVYEVAWTRLLALVIGPTTYAFSTMAAAFIAGLAVGSTAGTTLAKRSSRPEAWLSALLMTSAVASMAAAWYTATRLPLVVATEVANPNAALRQVVISQAIAVALLLLPSTLALGATFPLALAAAADPESTTGGNAARVYTANTVGAILGALVCGFALIPWLGLRVTFLVAAIVSIVAGAILASAGRFLSESALRQDAGRAQKRPFHAPLRFGGLAAGGAAIAAILLLPRWDQELLASGAYKYAPYLQAGDLDTVLRAGTLEYYKEGAAATVSVKRLTGVRSLAIDGKVDASDGADMLTQRLLGLLPVLLHGRARSLAVIGLGSGVTVASAC